MIRRREVKVILLVVCTISISYAVVIGGNEISDRTSVQDFENGVWRKTISGGSLRYSPDAESQEIMYVNGGSDVLISGYYEDALSQGYFKVTFNNHTGYLYTFLFEMDSELNLLIAKSNSFFLNQTFKEFERLKKLQNNIQANRVRIKANRANVRESDSLDSQIVDRLNRGSLVFIQSHIGEWYYIYYNPDVDLNIISNEKDVLDVVYRFAVIDYDSIYKKGWIHRITFRKSPLQKPFIHDK